MYWNILLRYFHKLILDSCLPSYININWIIIEITKLSANFGFKIS